MRLLRLGPAGAERPYAIDDADRVFDLNPITTDIDAAFLGSGGIQRTRDALAAGELSAVAESVQATGKRMGAPIARPGAVLCIGQNYAAHAAESGAKPPETPILFLKHPNTVVGPYDEVSIPKGAERIDWEVELGVVLGRRARYLENVEQALGCIAGFTVSNDVSERAYQTEHSGGQWSKGKCCETFNPLGPWLVPAGDLGDPQALRLRTWVNGAPRQDSSTADMIFGVAELVRHLSHYLTLDPGDLLNTGTPEGVALSGRFPYLTSGDVLELEIERLGRQRQQLKPAD